MDEEKKEIQIITGDISNLNISKVSDHLNSMKPKTKEDSAKSKKKIVIPETKKINLSNICNDSSSTQSNKD